MHVVLVGRCWGGQEFCGRGVRVDSAASVSVPQLCLRFLGSSVQVSELSGEFHVLAVA